MQEKEEVGRKRVRGGGGGVFDLLQRYHKLSECSCYYCCRYSLLSELVVQHIQSCIGAFVLVYGTLLLLDSLMYFEYCGLYYYYGS